MQQTLNRYLQLTPYFLSAAIVGALVFAWVPVLTGRSDIADILGRKIVEAGGYGDNYASVIGWTLHIIISVAYAKLYALLVSAPGFPQSLSKEAGARILAGLVAAVIIGWLTTWLSNPAISVAISLLSGQGWPAELAPIYFKLGLPLWNHLGFFLIAWLIIVVIPLLVQSILPAAAGAAATANRTATAA
jgi:hypothetical protein